MRSARSSSRSGWTVPTWLAPAILFVLALGLRLYHLNYHSLWFDEVMSTVWAGRPVAEIWRVGLALVEDKHPPLYYLLLHGWSAIFGASDTAVRLLGAVLGALAVFPTYAISMRIGDRVAATFGGLFVALNPFLVWYSQEARMFMPATAFALVGLYGIVRLADDGYARGGEAISRLGVLWAVTCIVTGFTLALYSYLFSAFLLPVALVWLAVLAGQARAHRGLIRIGAPGLLALCTVILLFLPLAHSAWLVSGSESAPSSAFSNLLASTWSLIQVYGLGWPSWPPAVVQALAAMLLVLAIVGLLPYPMVETADRRYETARSVGGILLATWLALPILMGGLLLVRDRTVFAETRYFIFLVPALCLSWGRALGWVLPKSRTLAIIGTTAALTVSIAALPYLWSPENRKEAWREAAAFVQAHAGPNDAVLVQADYVHPAFERYFPEDQQPVFYPFTDLLTDPAQVEAPLMGLKGFDAVWLVQSHHEDLDPDGLVAAWLATRYPLITEVFPPGIAIRGYLQDYQPDAAPVGLVGGGEAQAEGLRLLGCVYEPARLKATDDLFHPPSSWVHVTTYWTAGSGSPSDVAPVVRLLDGAGQVWGESLARAGSSFQRRPPSQWEPGEVVRADFEVNLNPATPAGDYTLGVVFPGMPGEPLPCGGVEIAG